MKTSTNKRLEGWADTYEPRNLKVNVAAWLAENHFSDKDVKTVDPSATFADFKSCICGEDHGIYTIDTAKMGRFIDNDEGYADTFIRDAIYSAIKAIA